MPLMNARPRAIVVLFALIAYTGCIVTLLQKDPIQNISPWFYLSLTASNTFVWQAPNVADIDAVEIFAGCMVPHTQ